MSGRGYAWLGAITIMITAAAPAFRAPEAAADSTMPARPTADAGPDRTVNEGATVMLDGSGSSHPGNIPLHYEWVQTSGPAVELSYAGIHDPTFTAPQVDAATQIIFTLYVGGNFTHDSDEITIAIRDTDGRLVYGTAAARSSPDAASAAIAWGAAGMMRVGIRRARREWVSRTAAAIATAAGVLLLLGCLAYLSPDGRRRDARPPALPALPGCARARVPDAAAAPAAAGDIGGDGSWGPATPPASPPSSRTAPPTWPSPRTPTTFGCSTSPASPTRSPPAA